VAEDASAILGVVLYVPPGKSGGVSIPVEWASVRLLCVTPRSRGRGIGRKLTQECIERGRRDGAKAIGLTTAEMMKIAQPMYERMGFKKQEELGERFGVKHGLYVMELNGSV
jgi:ribosomal protein S18 acetylase RimI-like enzyme